MSPVWNRLPSFHNYIKIAIICREILVNDGFAAIGPASARTIVRSHRINAYDGLGRPQTKTYTEDGTNYQFDYAYNTLGAPEQI
jgi:hypothetical protein